MLGLGAGTLAPAVRRTKSYAVIGCVERAPEGRNRQGNTLPLDGIRAQRDRSPLSGTPIRHAAPRNQPRRERRAKRLASFELKVKPGFPRDCGREGDRVEWTLAHSLFDPRARARRLKFAEGPQRT